MAPMPPVRANASLTEANRSAHYQAMLQMKDGSWSWRYPLSFSTVVILMTAEALLLGAGGLIFYSQAQVQGGQLRTLNRALSQTALDLKNQQKNTTAQASARIEELASAHRTAVNKNALLLKQNQNLEEKLMAARRAQMVASKRPDQPGPYHEITGHAGHELPVMYGQVPEKTIWSYWYHPKDCPRADKCVLPPAIQLCVDSVEINKGGFHYKIVHRDEVEQYVSMVELPFAWRELQPAQQKDSLMNALLARYGGVAFDISTILLRPIDDYWDEMVQKGATFRGYMYRLNGLPWRHAETTTVWFLMSRREGIFSIAVRNQVIGMGDRHDTSAYRHQYLALGDQTLTPILGMFNYSLPKCHDDVVVNVSHSSPLHQFYDQEVDWCPEYEGPPWFKGITGPPRNDTRILLRDPRDGPQLPFAFEDMLMWNTQDGNALKIQRTPGSPMQAEKCNTARECWDVFMQRFIAPPEPGQARLLSFVKIFKHAAGLKGKSRAEILAGSQTYFVQWLKIAGVAATGVPGMDNDLSI